MAIGVTDRDPVALGGEDHQRVGAEEGIAGPLLPAFDRFEQERVGAGALPHEGGQRRVEIGRQPRIDRNDISAAGQ